MLHMLIHSYYAAADVIIIARHYRLLLSGGETYAKPLYHLVFSYDTNITMVIIRIHTDISHTILQNYY